LYVSSLFSRDRLLRISDAARAGTHNNPEGFQRRTAQFAKHWVKTDGDESGLSLRLRDLLESKWSLPIVSLESGSDDCVGPILNAVTAFVGVPERHFNYFATEKDRAKAMLDSCKIKEAQVKNIDLKVLLFSRSKLQQK
jgi:hypothetical protein